MVTIVSLIVNCVSLPLDLKGLHGGCFPLNSFIMIWVPLSIVVRARFPRSFRGKVKFLLKEGHSSRSTMVSVIR